MVRQIATVVIDTGGKFDTSGRFDTGVVDTGVVDTGGKFPFGVIDISGVPCTLRISPSRIFGKI